MAKAEKSDAALPLIERVREHGNSQIVVEVPEWGCTIYGKPMTIFESKKINAITKGNGAEALVETVLMKCCDQDGKKLFERGDKQVLMKEASTGIIKRIAEAFLGIDDAEGDIDELEKN